MKRIFTYISVFLLLGFSSCEQELDIDFIPEDLIEKITDGEILVPFSISAFSSAETRSCISPSEDKISNYSVYFYQKGRLARELYMDSNRSGYVTLHYGQTYNVYVLANTGNLSAPEDESELQDFAYMTSGVSSIASDLPMSQAYGEVTVSETTTFSFVVKRLVSRISFSLDALPVKGLKVTSARLRNAPLNVYPFAEGGSKVNSSEVGDGDYATADDITALNKGGNIVFYVLENMQGTLLPGNTDPWKKEPSNIGSPDACTFIEAVCSFTESVDGREGTVTYRMYLGKDNITNFDVVRNTLMFVSIVTSEDNLDRVSWKVTPDYVQHVTSLTLDKDDLTIMTNQTAQLTATVLPEDAFDKTILWESSDPKIASVDDNGKITPLKVGSCVITARSNDVRDISDACNVTVIPAFTYEYELLPAGAMVEGKETTPIYYHEYKQFSLIRHKIQDEEVIESLDITATASWSTSDSDILTITAGKAYGNNNGNAVLSVTYDGETLTRNIVVQDKIERKLILSKDRVEVKIGQSLDLKKELTITFEKYVNGVLTVSKVVTDACTFEEQTTFYYTLTGEGVLTGLDKPYNDHYTFVYYKDIENGDYAINSLDINVIDNITYEMEVTPLASEVNAGSTVQLKAVYYTLTNGVKNSGTDVTAMAVWTSDDASVATVNGGLVTGVWEGTASIKASYLDLESTATVTVKNVITYDYRFFISGYNSVIAGQSTESYKVYFYQDTYINGNLASQGNSSIAYGGQVTWSISEGASYGSISSDGTLTGLAKGTVTVKAAVTYGGKAYECFKAVSVTQASSGGPDTGWDDGGDVDYN